MVNNILRLRINIPNDVCETKYVPSAYKVIKSLGTGGFGVVTVAQKKKLPTSPCVAVKRIKCKTSDNEICGLEYTAPLKRSSIEKEIDIWKTLDHPFINRYVESIFNASENVFYIVSELANAQDLFTAIYEQNTSLCQHTMFIPTFHLQITNAIKYLHTTMKLFHGDIKAENILLDLRPISKNKTLTKNERDLVFRNDELPPHLKFTNANDDECFLLHFQLTDFGAAFNVFPRSSRHARFRGTLAYIAPEFLSICHDYHQINEWVDPRCQDIWAFALTLWDLFLPKINPFRSGELELVLPPKYNFRFANPEVQFNDSIWLNDDNLGNRFCSLYTQKYGQLPARNLHTLMKGMTLFDHTQRMQISDITRFTLFQLHK